jgi:hypothetical protein
MPILCNLLLSCFKSFGIRLLVAWSHVLLSRVGLQMLPHSTEPDHMSPACVCPQCASLNPKAQFQLSMPVVSFASGLSVELRVCRFDIPTRAEGGL